MPESVSELRKLFESDEWINDGGAVVVKPGGEVVAGPMRREKEILYAEIDQEAASRTAVARCYRTLFATRPVRLLG